MPQDSRRQLGQERRRLQALPPSSSSAGTRVRATLWLRLSGRFPIGTERAPHRHPPAGLPIPANRSAYECLLPAPRQVLLCLWRGGCALLPPAELVGLRPYRQGVDGAVWFPCGVSRPYLGPPSFPFSKRPS